MKHRRIWAAVLLVAFAGFIFWRVAAFPKLRTEKDSYDLSVEPVIFVLETGARPISYGFMDDHRLQYDTPEGWRDVPPDPNWEEPFYLALKYVVSPFSSQRVMTTNLEEWNIAATGPGAYRLVFFCKKNSLFDRSWEEDILLTSQPFQLQ